MDNLKPFFIFFSSHFLLNLFKERNKKFILHVKRNLWNIRFFQFESLLYPVITYTLINRKHKYILFQFISSAKKDEYPSPPLLCPSIYQSPYYFQLNCPRISLNSEQTFFSLSSFCPRRTKSSFIHPFYTTLPLPSSPLTFTN